MSSDDYEVGYGKPPKHSQFKRGKSGNPNGRGSKIKSSIGEIFLGEGDRVLRIRVNGKLVSIRQAALVAKQLYTKAMRGDTRSFEMILKEEARQMDKARAPFEPTMPFSWDDLEIGVIQQGRAWASHCNKCGKPVYDEIERARKEYGEQGLAMPPIRYNGPAIEEDMQRFRMYSEELANADRELPQTSEPGRVGKAKKRRKGSILSFGELVVEEGDKLRRVQVDGKVATLMQRQIAARQQYTKATKGDVKAIALISKYESRQTGRLAVAVDRGSPPANQYGIIDVTLDFDEKPPPCFCAECDRVLKEFIACEVKNPETER